MSDELEASHTINTERTIINRFLSKGQANFSGNTNVRQVSINHRLRTPTELFWASVAVTGGAGFTIGAFISFAKLINYFFGV